MSTKQCTVCEKFMDTNLFDEQCVDICKTCKPMKTYNLKFLQSYCRVKNLTLQETPKKVNRDTKIKGYCLECKDPFEKSFRQMVEKSGAYCSTCTENNKHKKISATCQKKHGVNHHSQLPDVKAKKVKAYQEKYGVDNPMQCEEIKIEAEKTCQKKYGTSHQLKAKVVRDKIEKTKREKRMKEQKSRESEHDEQESEHDEQESEEED